MTGGWRAVRRLWERVGFSADFIRTLKKVPVPPAFR